MAPSRRCDGRLGPLDSTGPIKWAWAWVGLGLEVLGKLEGFRWILGFVRVLDGKWDSRFWLRFEVGSTASELVPLSAIRRLGIKMGCQ